MRPELAAEQEVDFGRYARTVGARWWLVVAAVGLGILVGYLLSLGGGDVYRATATVYLGQPLSPSGSSQIESLATNPTTVNEIVRSQSVMSEVADRVGVRAGRLRSGISTKAVAGAIARQGQTPLVEISVRGPWREESAAAANLLAETVVQRVSGFYIEVKIDSLQELLDGQNRELAAIDRRIEALQGRIEGSESADLDLLILQSLAEQRRGQLLEDRTETRQLLTLAENVESSRVVTEANPTQVSARSRRNSIVVGAVVGLLAGIALALAWQPLFGRRR